MNLLTPKVLSADIEVGDIYETAGNYADGDDTPSQVRITKVAAQTYDTEMSCQGILIKPDIPNTTITIDYTPDGRTQDTPMFRRLALARKVGGANTGASTAVAIGAVVAAAAIGAALLYIKK